MEKKSVLIRRIIITVLIVLLLAGGGFMAWKLLTPDAPAQQQTGDMELENLLALLRDPAAQSVTIDRDYLVQSTVEIVGEKELTGSGSIAFDPAVETLEPLLRLDGSAQVTLSGITIDAAGRGNGIYVPQGASFTLLDATVCFAYQWNIYNDGTLDIQGGSITGAAENNIINAASAQISGGTVSAAGMANLRLLAGSEATVTDGNFVDSAGVGIYQEENAQLLMNGQTLRVRDNTAGGLELYGSSVMDYANVVNNSAQNIFIGESGELTMNDGHISTAITSGIRNRGRLIVNGGVIEFNGYDGITNAGVCEVYGGSIRSNSRRGFTNETGGELQIEGEQIRIASNKFGLYNEVGAKATLRDVSVTASSTNNIRNFGELYLYRCTLADSTSVLLSTLVGSYVYLEDTQLSTNYRSHGIYNYAGTVEFKNLSISDVQARGIRNLGGSVTGDGLTLHNIGTTGITNENVAEGKGYISIRNAEISGEVEYAIYQFDGEAELRNFTIGVTSKNSLKVESGTLAMSNSSFAGCNGIPGSPDTAVYVGYFTGGSITLNAVSMRNSYSSMVCNRGGYVSLNSCSITNAGAAALRNGKNTERGTYGSIVCNQVSFNANQSANVKNDCSGMVTLNDCYLGISPGTNVSVEEGTVVLNGCTVAGTSAEESEKHAVRVLENATCIVRGDNRIYNANGKGISSAGTVYIYDGVIEECVSKNGAGVNNEGVCYIYDGVIRNNFANAGNGGAIRSTGDLYIYGGVIENNCAAASGGAISMAAYTYIENALIRNNYTKGEELNGGAIYVASGYLVLDKGAILTGNTASNHGGALAVNDSARVALRDGALLSENTAEAGSGGAIINYGEVTISGATLRKNTAGKHGGGIATARNGALTLSGGILEENTCAASGGAVFQETRSFTMTGGVVRNNKAGGLGGSVAVSRNSAMTMTGGTISGGVCDIAGGIYIASGSDFFLGQGAVLADGEAVYLVADPITLLTAYTTPIAVQLENYYEGAQVLRKSEQAPADAIEKSVAAVALSESGWYINETGVLLNSASVGDEIVAKIGEKEYTSLALAFADAPQGVETTVTIVADITLQGGLQLPADKHITLVSDSQGRTVQRGAGEGYLFSVPAGAELTLGDGSAELTIDGNAAIAAEGFFSVRGSLSINDKVTLQNGHSTGHGGFALVNGGQVSINGGLITGNRTDLHGGGLYLANGASLVMNGGEISGNTATGNSGGVHIATNSSFTMNGGSITANKGRLGGGIAIASGAAETRNNCRFFWNGGSIRENTASSGGAIFLAGPEAKVTLSGKLLSGDNDIYFNGAGTLTLAGALDEESRLRFTLASYEAGRQLLSGDAALIAAHYECFTSTAAGWALDEHGCLISTVSPEDYVAQLLSGERYASIEAAVAAAVEGDTLRLLSDCAPSATVAITKTLTIVGDGHTISHQATGGNLFTVSKGGSLTLGLPDGSDTLILDGGNMSQVLSARLLGVAEGSSIVMHPGVTLQNAFSADSGGGAVLVDGGSLTMNGGVISGNTAGTHGGAVYVSNSGSFVLNGGEISGNTATGNSGGVHIATNGSFTMNGGSITANKGKLGGGIAIASGAAETRNNCRFFWNGGEISDNVASTLGNAVYIASAEAKIALSGALTASGNEIYFNGAGTLSITAALGEQTSIPLALASYTAGRQVLSGSAELLSASKDCFTFPTDEWVLDENGCLKDNRVTQTGAVRIGDVYYDTLAQAFTTANQAGEAVEIVILENLTVEQTITVTGNVTLTDGGSKVSLTRSSAFTNSGTDADNLNGSFFYVTQAGSLTLRGSTGSTAEPTLVLNGANIGAKAGRFISADQASTVTLMSGVSLENANNSSNGGGAIYLNGAKLNVQGSTIATCSSSKTGGAVHLDGASTLTMDSGLISGNIAGGHGGAICLAKDSELILNGGTISGNTSTGGNSGGVHIASGATARINGGELVGNVVSGASNVGGNIAVAGSGKLYVNGGTLGSGSASKGKAVYMAGSAGTLSLGAGKVTGEIYLNGGAVIDLTLSLSAERQLSVDVSTYETGLQVLRGSAQTLADSAGFVSMADDSWLLDSSGLLTTQAQEQPPCEAKIGTTEYESFALALAAAQDGDTIVLCADVELSASGEGVWSKAGTVTITDDGTARTISRSSAILLLSTKANTGGTIVLTGTGTDTLILDGGGVNGRLLTVNAGTNAIINSGVVLKNVNYTTAAKGGGAAAIASGATLTMNGGTITGNSSTSDSSIGAGVWVMDGGKLLMNGGLISGNSAAGNGGGVAVTGAAGLEMTGGEISNNTATGFGNNVYFVSGQPVLGGSAYAQSLSFETATGGVSVKTALTAGKTMLLEWKEPAAGAPAVAVAQGLSLEAAIACFTVAEQWKIDESGMLAAAGEQTEPPQGAQAIVNGQSYSELTQAVAAANAATSASIVLKGEFVLSETLTITGNVSITDEGGASLIRADSFTNSTNATNTSGGLFYVAAGASLTLKGSGSASLVLDGKSIAAAAGRAVTVDESSASFILDAGCLIQNFSNSTNGGGAVYVKNGSFLMNGGVVQACTTAASKHGGAVFAEGTATVEIRGGSITACKSGGNSGALHMASGTTLRISGGSITANQGKLGGAIALAGKNAVTITGGTLSGNTASTSGNGIYVAANTVAITLSGAVSFTDDVFLKAAATYLTLAGDLGEEATVLVSNVTNGQLVLKNIEQAEKDYVAANCGKFLVEGGSFAEDGTVLLTQ